MSITSSLADLILDTRRILAARRLGTSRWDLWRTLLRLRRSDSRRRRRDAELLGYRVRCLEPENLAHLFREIFIRRLYDVQLDRPARTIIDCGSNLGLTILFFKHLYPEADIIGFEPSPYLFPILQENIARNEITGVTLHQKAVADKPATINFFTHTNDAGALNAGIYSTRRLTTETISVEADRLSNYITGEVDLLKLDVEGAEELVVRDLAESGKINHVRHLVCEYHHHHHREGNDDRLSVLLGLLEGGGFGYQLSAYYEATSAPRLGSYLYQDVMIYAYRKVS